MHAKNENALNFEPNSFGGSAFSFFYVGVYGIIFVVEK